MSDSPARDPFVAAREKDGVMQCPFHGEYRAIVETFFQRQKSPEMIAAIGILVGELLDTALRRGEFEAVSEFALPLQSRALTRLLNLPESEAGIWIVRGLHVFNHEHQIEREEKFIRKVGSTKLQLRIGA
jgi:cytochrome P450